MVFDVVDKAMRPSAVMDSGIYTADYGRIVGNQVALMCKLKCGLDRHVDGNYDVCIHYLEEDIRDGRGR